jgi:hypothetical protein
MQGSTEPKESTMSKRFDQCKGDCTADCGQCKGAGTIVIRAPRVPYPGPNDTDASFMRVAADHLEGGYHVGGSNLTATVIALLRDVARSLDERESNTAQRLRAGVPDREDHGMKGTR